MRASVYNENKIVEDVFHFLCLSRVGEGGIYSLNMVCGTKHDSPYPYFCGCMGISRSQKVIERTSVLLSLFSRGTVMRLAVESAISRFD